ncbi:zinc finger CCCH domain-containing protein 2-like [Trifolium pratense]|uniref:Zinc finger CCCH domain-containing protein 2-like n=1 Tax=Trifolium pratense TaxID=57577 RepID=A0A2K3L1B3_TRIPR|nr:zinc finger CCCH domain-containing protein 2-like [Trifolium pratense]
MIDNIPPRKLLTRRPPPTTADMSSDEDPYSSDHFRMYEFKIRRCTRSRSHDWTDCPFAHPGEKARRRDPLRFQYSGEVCPDYRRGNCERGDACEFSHGVFECWLHPSSGSENFLKEKQSFRVVVDDDVVANPDFGWVNELLM